MKSLLVYISNRGSATYSVFAVADVIMVFMLQAVWYFTIIV